MNHDRPQRLLAALTPAGITANQAHLFWSCAWETADALLKKMAAEGLLWAHKHHNGNIGYFRCQEDAEACKARVIKVAAASGGGDKARRAAADKRYRMKEAEIIIPPHIKVQVCPPFQGDYRIRADGSMPAGFIAEWHALRGQA